MTDVIELRREGNCWSVYVDGTRTVDRESYAVASRIVDELLTPGVHGHSEAAEVARSIRDWRRDSRDDCPHGLSAEMHAAHRLDCDHGDGEAESLWKPCQSCGTQTRYRSPHTGAPRCGQCLSG